MKRSVKRLFSLLLTAAALAGAVSVKAEDKTSLVLDRPALELELGQTDTLTASFSNGVKASDVQWSSDDGNIVSVDQNGNVKAVSQGETDITASADGKKAVCHVFSVTEKRDIFNENILISMFWPPIGGYITEEQYRWMAEAGINYVMGAGENVGYKESQLKMLEYCYKYGMRMTVGDDRMGPSLFSMSSDNMKKLFAEYKNVPGVGGYWLVDEPGAPNDCYEAYKSIKSIEPDKYVYINFLPGVGDAYKASVDDWLRLSNSVGCEPNYYIYDFYPFRINSTETNTMLYCLNTGWEAGLANKTKTGAFLQSISSKTVFRLPTEDELRWQVNLSLAYGNKYLSYFTWFLPGGGENFTSSIIDRSGNKTPLYDTVTKINHEALALGKTLVGLDALKIYYNGNRYDIGTAVPGDFFAQPTDNADYLLSYMRDSETKRNYIMLVNTSSKKSVDIALKLDSSISSLRLVSISDGSLSNYNLDGNTLSINAQPGGGYLFELPENCDFADKEPEVKNGDNLVKTSYVTANASQGRDSYYIKNLADGKRYSTEDEKGWRGEFSKGIAISFDLGKTREVNRADFYPAGSYKRYGTEMPTAFTIDVSDDGTSWKTVYTIDSYKQTDKKPLSVTFDKTSARYLRVSITGCDGQYVSLAEVELYCDDGSVPSPEEITAENSGLFDNLTGFADITATSAQDSYGWSLPHLTDGERVYTEANASNGYCSATDKPVDVTFDFKSPESFDRIVIYPASEPYTDYMPKTFSFDISNDGENWKTVYSEDDYSHNGSMNAVEYTFDTVSARYLRWHIEAPAKGEVCVGELEIYCDNETYDLSKLANRVSALEQLDMSIYTSDSAAAVTAALANCKQLLSLPDTKPEDYEAAYNTLEAAYAALIPLPETDTKPVTTDITEIITDAPDSDNANTTDDSGNKGGKTYIWIVSAVVAAVAATAIIMFVRIKKKNR